MLLNHWIRSGIGFFGKVLVQIKGNTLISWQISCFAKEFGRLEILDLKQMNLSLLMRWWWKHNDPNYHSNWKHIITTKYYTGPHRMPYSEFWAAIVSVDNLGQINTSYTLGVNTSLFFWTYIWYQSCTLASRLLILNDKMSG